MMARRESVIRDNRRRARLEVRRVMRDHGFSGLIEARSKFVPLPLNNEHEPPSAKIAASVEHIDGDDLDQLLSDITQRKRAEALKRGELERALLPDAASPSVDELRKAIKYAFGSPLNLKFKLRKSDTFEILVFGGSGLSPLVRGGRMNTDAERAKTAVVRALQRIAGHVDTTTFEFWSPTSLMTLEQRLLVLLQVAKNEMEGAIRRSGYVGLCDLAHSGLPVTAGAPR